MLFIIILILSFLAGFVLPWWSVAVIAFLAAAFLSKTNVRSFWSGFGGVAIAWIILALLKSIPNDHILVKKVTHLFQLPHWILILLITALIGGLVGGMSALSGILFRKAIKTK